MTDTITRLHDELQEIKRHQPDWWQSYLNDGMILNLANNAEALLGAVQAADVMHEKLERQISDIEDFDTPGDEEEKLVCLTFSEWDDIKQILIDYKAARKRLEGEG